MGQDISRLPEMVVVRMSDDLVPKLDLIVKVQTIDILERPQIEKELVAVRRAVFETVGPSRRGSRSGHAEAGQEVECQRQYQCTVMVHVVPEPVCNGCLRRDGP